MLETDSNGRFVSVRIGDDTIKYTLNAETITDALTEITKKVLTGWITIANGTAEDYRKENPLYSLISEGLY